MINLNAHAKAASAITFLMFAVCLIGLALLQNPPASYENPHHYLWRGNAPGGHSREHADRPYIQAFFPKTYDVNRPAIIICPGGAYRFLTSGYEGASIAKKLNDMGITAFVLFYRRAPDYHYPAPVDDVQRAVRYVRHHAGRFSINPNMIGVLGFSAGGHLASTAAIHYSRSDYLRRPNYKQDVIDKVSARPDFAVLGYPIITLQGPYQHHPSTQHFLGARLSKHLQRKFSNHLHVTHHTPPMFIFHTYEDEPVPVENSIMLYSSLRTHKVPVEMHLYEQGKHGAGLADGKNNAPLIPTLQTWPVLLKQWLYGQKILSHL